MHKTSTASFVYTANSSLNEYCVICVAWHKGLSQYGFYHTILMAIFCMDFLVMYPFMMRSVEDLCGLLRPACGIALLWMKTELLRKNDTV